MRIAFEATAAVRQYAGVGRFARGLLAGLRTVDAHNEYTLLSVGQARIALPTDALPRRATWRTVPVPERLATILWQRWQLMPSPAVLCHGANMFVTPDYALMRVGRLPSVVTVHDLSFLTHPECAERSLRLYLEKVVPRSVARATVVFAVSHATADALRRLLGVPGGKIVVVPNGVEPGFREQPLCPEELQAALRTRFQLTPGYLLSVGTLEPRKNYVRLLQAFAQLRHRSATRALTLVIAGREGWMYEPIFREAARLGLGNALRFITRADDQDLRNLYTGARLFIYGSLYEGFGIPPLEALAAGTPVVASHAGALPEVLGDAALYFDPCRVEEMAEVIAAALEDVSGSQQRTALGRLRAAQYTWEAAAATALAAFESLKTA